MPVPSAVAGRGWPLNAAEEAALVRRLRGEPSRMGGWTTTDASMLLGLLRGGNSVEQVRAVLPTMPLGGLASCYAHLAEVLSDVRQAWDRTVTAVQTGQAAAAEDLALAELLLPVPVAALRQASRRGLADQVLAVVLEVEAVTSAVRDAEAKVQRSPEEVRARRSLALLHVTAEGTFAGLYAHGCYLPGRVGTLSPQRVSSLLSWT
jgi:hypothetical protein